jgi:hypothetical protein
LQNEAVNVEEKWDALGSGPDDVSSECSVPVVVVAPSIKCHTVVWFLTLAQKELNVLS